MRLEPVLCGTEVASQGTGAQAVKVQDWHSQRRCVPRAPAFVWDTVSSVLIRWQLLIYRGPARSLPPL